jgi:sulfite reductase beta subunit-like hemoprotein
MKADMFQDVKRTGYYNFFEQLSQAALEVAASTSYDHDPLEREARRITGYDGPLSGDEFNLWLYGSKEPTASILRALDRVRMLGGARSAYAKMSDERNLVLAGIPEEHSERICEIATEFAKATTAVPWHAFISAVCLALDIQPVRKSTSDRFDLMVAYLRMKGSMSASTIANANVLVAPSNQGD